MFADWTIRARRRDDDVTVEWRGLSVCELRDGRIAWWREHHLAPPAPIDGNAARQARAVAIASISARNWSTASLNAFGASAIETVRGAAQHVEARRRDQLGQLLGVAERRERVLGTGDHERGRGDRVQLVAHVVGHGEDRVDLRDERLRLRLHEHAREHVHEHTEAPLQPRADEPAHAVVVGERVHAALPTPRRPHSASSSRRHSWCRHAVHASTSERDALGVHDADDLRDHAAHRRADHVRALDAFRVEHLDRVLRHPHEVVRAGRRVGVAGAAVVDRDAAMLPAERAALEPPRRARSCRAPGSSAPATRPRPPGVVRDAHAVSS